MNAKLITCALLMASAVSYSQDYRPGYIVTSQGDTLRGQLAFRQNARVFSECDFIKPGNSEPVKYTPDMIRAYRFDGDKLYQSIDLSSVVNAQSDLPNTKVFGHVLVGGELSFYIFENFYLVSRTGEKPYQLYNTRETIERPDIQRSGSQTYIHEKKEYIGLLKFLSQNCDKINYENVGFNRQSLYKAVIRYNKCATGEYNTYTEEEDWIKLKIGIELGFQVSSFTIEEEYKREAHMSQDFDPSTTIFPAVFFEFSTPRLNEDLAFEAGLMYLGNLYRSEFTLDNGYTVSDYDVLFDIKQIKIPLAIKYNFTGSRVQPFLLGGISTSYFISGKSHYTVHHEYAVDLTYDGEESDFVRLKKGQFGLHGAAGIAMRFNTSISGYIKISYEHNNGLLQTDPTDTDLARSNINNIQVSAGIKL